MTDALTSTDRLERHPLMKLPVCQSNPSQNPTIQRREVLCNSVHPDHDKHRKRVRCKRFLFAYSHDKATSCRKRLKLFHKMVTALQLDHSALQSVSPSAMPRISAPETWAALRCPSHTSSSSYHIILLVRLILPEPLICT